MKKIFTFFLGLAASMGIVYASDTQVDGIWYDFDSNNHTASVTYRGDCYYDYAKEYTGNVVIPSSVTYNGITYSVTSIGDNAFYDCTSLTSVTIPNSITSIGRSAFAHCSSLTSFTIPNSVTSIGSYAFRGCSSLTSVTIPNSITSIGSSAFEECSSLTSFTIPNSVTSIGEWAFRGCSSLKSITIPNSVTSIEGYTFYGCSSLTSVTIPNSVTSIGSSAFEGCSSLTSITIPNTVTSIEWWAFDGCSSLTFVSIPNSVTSIGSSVFGNCSSLTSIVVEAGNTTYDSRENCNAIIETASNTLIAGCQKTTIPNSVTSIESAAFSGCSSLTSVTIPNSVTSIGESAFSGCSSLASITIPNNVTSIGYAVFSRCSSLASITIPNSVTSIGDIAFYRCSSLTSVTIGNSVTSIGDEAFYRCEKLGTLVLGDKLKKIGDRAFDGCNKLYHIYCYAPEPPIIEDEDNDKDNVFTNYNVNLYVPCNYLDNYKYDIVFGSFRYIQCIDSEDVAADDVVVSPGTNDVTITWPTEGNADTYTIVIKKGNDVFCTLTFNADGQLLNIAFAPGRDGNHPVQYAEQAGKGYRFTVTSLESGTKYGYNIDVKDASNKTIKSHSGEFTTQSTTAVEEIEVSDNTNVQKTIHDGQLYILKNGKTYNAMGQEM